jgi:hypothetical protein
MIVFWASAGVVLGAMVLFGPMLRRHSPAVRLTVAAIWAGATATLFLISRSEPDGSVESFLGALLLTMGIAFIAKRDEFRVLGVILAVAGAIFLLSLLS